MANGLTSKFHRYLAEIGIAVSSIISPTSMHVDPIQPEKKKKAPNLLDALASDEFHASKDWEGIAVFDDHIYRYSKLDDMVNFSDDISGFSWHKVCYRSIVKNEVPYMILEGTRSDNKKFSISSRIDVIDEKMNDIFDDLCVKLNHQLGRKA